MWLEQGNAAAGLQHILSRHAKDFETKLGISEANLTKYPHDVVSKGEIIENKVVKRHGREGYSRKYRYRGKEYILTGIGLNGFLVSAYSNE